ncbi:Sodium/hydrogen exchanger 8 [Armadillidium nasatum]|uniref:Sodium/hydrogen exchanger n=1 Tax=Armadillidium nasatum TaxID=96803 RepID=A0A5N5SQM2_9CRUS|nr:Sodium/hydrogen exchanger 8 [Armadillidium nasatum]
MLCFDNAFSFINLGSLMKNNILKCDNDVLKTSEQLQYNNSNQNVSSTSNKTSVLPEPVLEKIVQNSDNQNSADSPININIPVLLQPDEETHSSAQTSPPDPAFVLHVGNVSVSNVCNISETEYSKFSEHYLNYCSKTTESHAEESAIESVSESANDTSECQQSVDLPAKGAAEQEHLSSLSIFLILCVLGICILMIFFLLKTKLNYLPESVACVIIGAIIGLCLKIMYRNNIANWQKEEAFSPTVFFLVILPPIIFESGYNLHKGNFFQNIGSVLTFAILGTIISALVIGGGVYLLGQADVVYRLTFVESFAFGSLISAVDPVATLAIFPCPERRSNSLYVGLRGETILELASPAMSEMGSGEAVLYTFWRFCVMFFASAGIGVAFALLSALTLKYIPLREYTSLELCIVIIFIYAPYTLAEGVHLSGIMAILFNGIVMSHYTHFNLSPVMQITMQHLMRTLALIGECSVFIYLGLAIFSFRHHFHAALVIWSIILCLIGRATNIYPLSWLVNKFRDHQITKKMMFIMWFSGLRGAIAYALSLHLEFADEKRHVIVTTTLIIVLFTIFFLGGSTLPLIKFLKAEKKSKKLKKSQSEKHLTLSKTRELGQALDSEHLSEFTEEESDTPTGVRLRGFLKFDALYLRPLLVRRVTHQEVRSYASDLKKQCYQSINVQASDSEEDLFIAT